MDRREAIGVIKGLLADRDNDSRYPCVSSPKHYEALDLAIEALGQTESEDCISRADLIESFLADNECEREDAKACMCSLDLMLELVEDAPSVVPTERNGERIEE